MKQFAKCKGCGATLEVSRDGWLTDSVVRENGKIVVSVAGKVKREVRYTEWIHIPGHMNGRKMCPGSGASPVRQS